MRISSNCTYMEYKGSSGTNVRKCTQVQIVPIWNIKSEASFKGVRE